MLASDHNLESVEIVEGGPLLLGGKLLGPAGRLPLGLDLGVGPGFLDGLGAGVAGNLDGEVGEGDAAVGDDLTADAGDVLGSVDEALVLVDNIDDGSELAGLGSVVDEDNASNLDVSGEAHFWKFIGVKILRKLGDCCERGGEGLKRKCQNGYMWHMLDKLEKPSRCAQESLYNIFLRNASWRMPGLHWVLALVFQGVE